MKRLLTFIIVLTLLVLGGTLVSANSQTRRERDEKEGLIQTSETIRGV